MFDSALDSRAVTVTGEPSATGFGEADRLTVGGVGVVPPPSSSEIVICTELGLPPVTDDGRLAVFSATVNVSSSSSASWFVVTVPVPVVEPELTAMLDSVP